MALGQGFGSFSPWRVALCYKESSGHISQRLSSLHLSETWGDLFQIFTVRNRWDSWQKYGGSSKTPGVSHSYRNPHSAASNLSKLPFKCPSEFMTPEVSTPGKQISAVTLWFLLSQQTSRCLFALQLQFSDEYNKMPWFLVVQVLCVCVWL